jgi:3-isopropylmalate dehydratase small subunit
MTEEVKEVDPTSAKEQASKFIGKYGLGVVLVLVLAGIYAAGSLEAGTLAVVMSMISTVVMAVIGILMGITGTKDKEEKPEITIIRDLIDKASKEESPMQVDVSDGKVTVRKGDSLTTLEK